MSTTPRDDDAIWLAELADGLLRVAEELDAGPSGWHTNVLLDQAYRRVTSGAVKPGASLRLHGAVLGIYYACTPGTPGRMALADAIRHTANVILASLTRPDDAG